MNLKILHVIPSFIPAYRYGGIVFAVHQLAKVLAANDVDVTICTTSVDGVSDSDVQHNVMLNMDDYRVIYFRSKSFRRLYYSKDMAQYLDNHVADFDIVHLHSIFLFPTNYAAKICRKKNIPYILTPHGMLDQYVIASHNKFVKSLFIKLFESKTISGAKAIHLTSNIEYKHALQTKVFQNLGIAALQKCWIIPNGISIDHQEHSLDSNDVQLSRKDILFIGRLSWKKRIEDIIESLIYLPEDVKLNIVGNDEENYQPVLERCVQKHKLSHRVFFYKAIYGQQKATLFSSSKLCVVCSISENFALVVLEAMSYGCPVVVTKNVGASEIVKTHNVGVITTNQPEQMAEDIENLLKDESQYLQMSEKSAQCAIKYHWPNLVKSYVDMYKTFSIKPKKLNG